MYSVQFSDIYVPPEWPAERMTTREKFRFAYIFCIGLGFVAICGLLTAAGIISGDDQWLVKYTALLTIYWAIHFIFLFRHRASFNGKLDVEEDATTTPPTKIIRYSPELKYGTIAYSSTLALFCGLAAYEILNVEGEVTWPYAAIFGLICIWFASLPGAYLFKTFHRGYLAFTPEGIRIQSWARKSEIPWGIIEEVEAKYTKKSNKEFGYPETTFRFSGHIPEQKYSTFLWRMGDRQTFRGPRIDYRKISSDHRLVHDFVVKQVKQHQAIHRDTYQPSATSLLTAVEDTDGTLSRAILDLKNKKWG